MAEKKNPQLDAQHQAILKRMMQLPENKECADCHSAYPRWASTNLGIFICMSCSGIHRKLGTHLSQVRSVTLDTWTPAQIARFQKLGNAKAAKYFEACLPQDFQRPHSSDNMRMEGFIRAKYEAKRYITVENGGLGGAPPGRFGASSAFTSSNTLGPRPTQQPGMPRRYDDVGRSTSSMSYASRFQGNGSQPPLPRALPQSDPKSHLDAVTRASTLRELVKMGFSTQLSLRAVEAASGDLQRAVDWLLQDAAKDPPSKSAPALAPNRPSTTSKPVAADLLDFSDTSGNLPAAQASTVKTDANSDFADFGDFESALPTASSVSTSAIPSTQGSKSLSSSLADLYKQKRPAVPPPLSSDLKSPAHGPPKTAKNRNTGALNVAGKPTEDVKTGLPVFDIKPSIPATNDSQRPTGFQEHGATRSTPNLQSAQPPPPPMQEMAFPTSEDGPLPPSPTTQPMSNPNAERLKDPSEMKPESQVRKAPIKLDREEDQDPFAALSMMALSSASSSKKSALKLSAVPMATSRDTAASKEGANTPGSPGFNDFFG